MKNCKHCFKSINDEEDHFYIGYWYKNKTKSTVIHYHKDCFECVAGIDHVNAVLAGDIDSDHYIVDEATTDTKIRWKYIYWKEE